MGLEPTTLSLGSYDSAETTQERSATETPDPACLQGSRQLGPHGHWRPGDTCVDESGADVAFAVVINSGRGGPRRVARRQQVSVRRRAGGRPRRAPGKITIEERRAAIRFWKAVGVLDERGTVTAEWHRRGGAALVD
jgi:hypothetical protein